MPTIRLAEPGDSDSINVLSSYLGYAISPSNIAKARLRRLLDSNSDWVWVAEGANGIVGWIHLFTAHRLASKTCNEIGGLVVDPAMRNKGLGSQLVEYAANRSAAQNRVLRVRCNIKRLEACRFYEKVGFIKAKSQRVFEQPC